MNPIDKKIREKFHNQQTAVDTDALWKEVYPSIKKKRKPYLGFLLIACLSIIATSIFWQLNKSQNSLIEDTYSYNNTQHQNKKHESLATLNVKDLEIETTDKMPQKVLEETFVHTPKVQTKISEKTNKSKIKGAIKTNELIATYSENTTANNSFKTKTPVKANRLSAINNVNTKNTINSKSISGALILSDKEDVRIQKSILAEEHKSLRIEKATRQKINSEQLQKIHSVLLFEHDMLSQRPKLALEKEKRNWFINPSLGLYFTNRKLSTSESRLEEQIIERNNKESQLETVMASLAVGTEINKHWGVAFGANYRATNELAENNIQIQDTVTKENILIEIRNTPSGMQEEIYGSAEVPQIIIKEEGRYSTYQSVSAFADVFYRFHTKKILWQAQVGLQQSILLKAKGHIIDQAKGFYNIQNDLDNYLAKTGGLSFRTSLGVVLPINESWSINANTQFIKDFNSLFSKQTEIIQKYQILGINAGVQLAF